jgi:hypothetical protein
MDGRISAGAQPIQRIAANFEAEPGAKVKFRARTSRCEGNESRASLVKEGLFGGLNEMGAGKPGAHEVSTLV